MAALDLNDWLDGVRPHRDKTAYVAAITGEHPKYGFDREFVSDFNGNDSSSGKHVGKEVALADVQVGGVFEVRHDSWNNDKRRYQIVVAIDEDAGTVETERLTEAEVLDAVENPAAYLPDEEDDDSTADEHHCEECGESFETFHGLAVDVDEAPSTAAANDPPVATDGGRDQDLDPADVDLEPGQVYTRRGPSARPPARVEVVRDEDLTAGYRVKTFDTHDNKLGGLNPAFESTGGDRKGNSIADIKRWIAEGELQLSDADPGDLPPTAQEKVDALRADERARVDEDGLVYNPNIFDRWQKHGHDRLYVRDPGEGYLDLSGGGPLVGEDLTHPEPQHHIGGKRKWVDVDGGRALFASDGASSDWAIAFIPAELLEEDAPDGGEDAQSGDQPVTDGGETADATPPHKDDFEQPVRRKHYYEIEDDDGPAGGISFFFPNDALDPAVPYYSVQTRDHGSFDLNIGIERDQQPGAWRSYLSTFPYEDVGMEVGELLVWHRSPQNSDDESHVYDRYTLDGRTLVETGETIEEYAKRLLHEVTGVGQDDTADTDDDDDAAGESTARTDGGSPKPDAVDHPPVLAVDWDAVEADVGIEIPAATRDWIERTGSHYGTDRADVTLPGADAVEEHSTAMMAALHEHGRWRLPDGTLLETDVAGPGAVQLSGALRKVHGANMNVATLVEAIEGDEIDFAAGVRDLYDAATQLRAERDDWVEDRQPALRMGSYGPDYLGNLYVTAAHSDRAVLEDLSLGELPVDREHIRKGQDCYSITLRHERYYQYPWASDPWGKRTHRYLETVEENHDLRGRESQSGGASIEAIVQDEGGLIEQDGTVDYQGTASTIRRYRYELDGDERWAVEWTDRVDVDEVVTTILTFDSYPTAADVDAVQAGRDARKAFRRGEASPEFRCWECGTDTHWLDVTDGEGNTPSLRDRIDQAKRTYCGC